MEDNQRVNTHRKWDLNHFSPSLALTKAAIPSRQSAQLSWGHMLSGAPNPPPTFLQSGSNTFNISADIPLTTQLFYINSIKPRLE